MRYADADAEPALVALEKDRLVHLGDDPVRQDGQLLVPVLSRGIGRRRADDDELVAADARHEIIAAGKLFEHRCRMDQHCVTGRVAERVVDLLEAVEIDMQQADALAGMVEEAEMPVEHVVEEAPVGQPGKQIVQGVELDAGLGCLQFRGALLRQRVRLRRVLPGLDLLGNVRIHPDDLARLAGVAICPGAFMYVSDLPIDDQPVFDLHVAARFIRVRLHRGDAGDVIGMDAPHPVLVGPVAVIGRVAVELVHAVVPDQPVGFEIEFFFAAVAGLSSAVRDLARRGGSGRGSRRLSSATLQVRSSISLPDSRIGTMISAPAAQTISQSMNVLGGEAGHPPLGTAAIRHVPDGTMMSAVTGLFFRISALP